MEIDTYVAISKALMFISGIFMGYALASAGFVGKLRGIRKQVEDLREFVNREATNGKDSD